MTPSGPERREAGSVLLLFPAAVLVVVVLAAITVDSAVAFLGQREVANAVAAAANDATGQGVGNRAFYEEGRVDLDPVAVRRLAAEQVVATLDAARFHGLHVEVSVSPAAVPGCPPAVRVHASAHVSAIFAAAIPGSLGRFGVRATASASPREVATGC